MYMNAEIELQAPPTASLPEACIVNFKGENYIFVEIGKQQYKMRPVTLGVHENGFVQILNAEEVRHQPIIWQNAYTLLMKLKNTEEE